MSIYKKISLKLILSIFVLSIVTTHAYPAKHNQNIKYFIGLVDKVNYEFDHKRAFWGELKERELSNTSRHFYYRVYYSNEGRRLRAEGVDNKTNNTSSMLIFNKDERLIRIKNKYQNCFTAYNSEKKIKREQCLKKDGSVKYTSISEYKNNLIFKRTVYDSNNKLDYYTEFDHKNMTRKTYNNKGVLKKTAPLEPAGL